MIHELLIALALSCPNPEIINKSGHKWNKFDQQTLNRAKKRCGELYPKSPCLKKFIKVKKLDYLVTCGKEKL